MTFDERHNEVMKAHAAFLNALAVAAAGGAGFSAISSGSWTAAIIFMLFSNVLHLAAAELLQNLRISR
jgi:hypothetical protein